MASPAQVKCFATISTATQIPNVAAVAAILNMVPTTTDLNDDRGCIAKRQRVGRSSFISDLSQDVRERLCPEIGHDVRGRKAVGGNILCRARR
jgi:hypothetical protein